ncbi:MAG: hypothetical protein ACRECO_18860 [Xanthobacteraceae bacterium]
MSITYFESRRAPDPRSRPRRSVIPVLPIIAVCAVALAAVGYVGSVLWPHWPGPTVAPNAPSLPIMVGGVAFNLPPAAIRVPMQRRSGAHERIDLVYLWPSLDPPDPAPKPGTPKQGTAKQAAPTLHDRIFMTILVARDSLSPKDRVKAIYSRYASSVPVPGPSGLAVLPFRIGTPYQGEDLVYDGATPDNFLVRCTRNGAGRTPGICLYSQRIDTADITVRFPRDWLEDWQSVDASIEGLIAKLRGRP